MFELQHIDHVALYVNDLESSTKWYQDTLGLERHYQEAWPTEPVMLCAGSTCIALFKADSADAPLSGVNPVRMSHVAFKVDWANFEKARAELPERGIELRFADHGICHSIYLSDADGYQIEITTYEV